MHFSGRRVSICLHFGGKLVIMDSVVLSRVEICLETRKRNHEKRPRSIASLLPCFPLTNAAPRINLRAFFRTSLVINAQQRRSPRAVHAASERGSMFR